MFILWLRKVEKQRKTKENTSAPENMKEHNEEMKKFRDSHADFHIVPARDIMTADGDLLAPVQSVKLSPNVCN